MMLSLNNNLGRNKHQEKHAAKTRNCSSEQEVNSIEWELINMSEEEEDLINRMYRLVGDRWKLIAGRIPGRKPEEIERFWIMKHGQTYNYRRFGNSSKKS